MTANEIKQNLDNQISLEEYIKFRTNSNVRSIIYQSIDLFETLVLESTFFKFFQDEPEKRLSQQELKLQACVECQKLRSVIRYEWVTKCLTLAPFESDCLRDKPSHKSTLPLEIEAEELIRMKLHDLLAMLMGHLLRQHFLSFALDHLFRLVESHRLLPSSRGVDLSNKLVIPVQLTSKSSPDGIELIDCSQPDKELKETLGFLVDEIASVCHKLPRLETQLASQTLDTQAADKINFIRVLQEGDGLLDEVKSHFGHLVDRAFYSRELQWWIDPDYEKIIKLLNSLRFNDAPGQLLSGKEPAEIRLKQLKFGCQQLDLINQQELKLHCELKRYYDYGFVLLDYEPLRQSLIQCARKERLIMTRLILDDLLKLMHRLQMQFDEAEIGVDLESAIDDYLGERRQQQHQQQQLVLSSSESLDQEEPLDYQSDSDSKITSNEQTMIQDEDEAFMNALAGSGASASANQQFMALSTSSSMLNSMAEQRVAPVVECQLLLAKYKFMRDLITKELEPIKEDLQVAFKGLVFLSEYVNAEQLEPSHSDLIMELATRARELTPILSQALDRLHLAQHRLLYSNHTRSVALSKLVVEFHLLMSDMSRRKLHQGDPGQARQLDYIQETTEWANQLESRFEFLLRQNSLLSKESFLLRESRLSLNQIEPSPEPKDEDNQFLEDIKSRAEVLERWRQPVSWIASFWRLVERYETQQVKWLNSDIKRIDFGHLEKIFHLYKQRWLDLHGRFTSELKDIDPRHKAMLEKNLYELKLRLEQFEELRLPLFKFLTNRHLTEAHWSRLSELLSEERRGISSGSLIIQPQACTTLAQFLELNLDKYVDELKSMNQQAIIEQELRTFLEVEADRARGPRYKDAHLGALAITRAWFDGWTDKELIVAASRFIELKLSQSIQDESLDSSSKSECYKLSRYLIDTHNLVKRHISLRYALNLDQPVVLNSIEPERISNLKYLARGKLIIRTCNLLASPNLVTPALFVEFLKLVTESWIKGRQRLGKERKQVELSLGIISQHLSDIQSLISNVNELHRTDLRRASMDSERILIHLEREMASMELEREILATKEALALERQREALATRDECIRQITERAIPAIRAAAKALDCLDGKSLRALRSLRPSPPEPIRLVLEAVCLLRCCCIQQLTRVGDDGHGMSCMKPERRFDPLKGRILEDYWPAASRMLNGTHSSKFIADLRQVDKRHIPIAVMRLIRRRYLSSSKFKLSQVARVSQECALLAKWLIAVDVFDRVINVVRPNYRRYMNADRHLSELLAEVNNRRRQIELICGELRELEDSFENKIGHKMSLVDSLDQCKRQLKQVESTRTELLRKRQVCMTKIEHLKHNETLLMDKCVLRVARYVYVGAMRFEERKPMTGLLRRQTLAAGGPD